MIKDKKLLFIAKKNLIKYFASLHVFHPFPNNRVVSERA